MAVSIRRRRSDETPTDSGVAGARSRTLVAAALPERAAAADGAWADGEMASGAATASAARKSSKRTAADGHGTAPSERIPQSYTFPSMAPVQTSSRSIHNQNPIDTSAPFRPCIRIGGDPTSLAPDAGRRCIDARTVE